MLLSTDHLKRLIDLQKSDLDLDKRQPVLGQIPIMIGNLRKQLSAEKGRAREAQQQVAGLEARRKEKELELAQEEEGARRYAAEMISAQSKGSRRDLETELAFARQAVLEKKEELQQLTQEVSVARENEKAVLADIAVEVDGFEAVIAGHQARLTKARVEFDAAKSRRDQAAAIIPIGAMKIYDHIRSRGKPNPVAPIEGTICGACRIRLAPQVIVEATKMKSLVCCESCQRILYRPEVLAK